MTATSPADADLPAAIWSGDGYAAISLADGELVAELQARWHALGVADDHEFYASNVHADRATAREVDQGLKELLGPALATLLPGWEPFLGAFISKGPMVHNQVGVHQDWTYSDEADDQRSLLIWCPLVDVDERSATLRVVPGSHRWSDHLRGSGVPAPLQGAIDRLDPDAQCVAVPLQAGDALLYDAALLHGSAGNAGGQVRTAAAVALAPAGAQLVHYHRPEQGGEVEGYLIDEAFYTTQPFGGRPEGYERRDPAPELVGSVGDDDAERLVATLPPTPTAAPEPADAAGDADEAPPAPDAPTPPPDGLLRRGRRLAGRVKRRLRA